LRLVILYGGAAPSVNRDLTVCKGPLSDALAFLSRHAADVIYDIVSLHSPATRLLNPCTRPMELAQEWVYLFEVEGFEIEPFAFNRVLKNRASRRDPALCGYCKCSHIDENMRRFPKRRTPWLTV